MEPACIRHSELPGTSRLFLDFCYHFDRVARFYRHDPQNIDSFTAAAREIDYPDARRAAIVHALAGQNGPSTTLDRLAQPGTVAIVTGQQVGLFSGPAYTVYKAVTAARLAKELTERGTPAVPVFWLATEDHDLEEVDHSWAFDSGRQPVELRARMQPINGRPRPVGGLRIEQAPIDDLRRALKGLPHADDVLAMVSDAYRDGATMGEGFRALLKTLLAPLGLIFLDPLDPEIRKIGAPLIADALNAAPELRKSLLARNRELEDAGYHAQVHLLDKTSLFFLLENGERVPLRLKDSEFKTMRSRAAEISPNALLRPVMQDYLLPTCSYVGGPAELAYLAQSQVIYDRLLGRMPVMIARAGFTLLEAHTTKLLERYELALPQVFIDEEHLKQRVARALVPESLEKSFIAESEGIMNHLGRMRSELDRFDPTLASSLEKSSAKIAYQLEKARRKTASEMMRRNDRSAGDARYLSGFLFPHRHLQERFYSILPFIAAHGTDLVERLYDAVQLDCPDHRILSI
ncbi:MAG TPA: bacillithiol biosynthesis cysteine-adding enzyme BshC [Bryobacteraceae bacterium]|nr:bacillithiol biosynthesis cysteine-adding enzyme BshC [Bryobacteraceae bacterium]